MSRSIRLYTPAQFEEVRTIVDLLAERSELPPAERGKLTAFQADLQQTIREDRRRAAGTTRLAAARADRACEQNRSPPPATQASTPAALTSCTTSAAR